MAKFVREIFPAFLLASVGPFAIASTSQGDFWLGELITTISFCACLSISVTTIRRLVLRDVNQWTGIAIDTLIVALFTLPFLVDFELRGVLPEIWAPRIRTILIVSVAIGAIAARVIFERPPQSLIRPIKILTIACGFSCLISALTIVYGEVIVGRVVRKSPTLSRAISWNIDSAAANVKPSNRPDIFLIVLDGYANDSLLRVRYGVDHSAMRDTLTVLGFQPERPYSSNYVRTSASLSSMLNFEHVAPAENEPATTSQHAGVMNFLIGENRTAKLLSKIGYDIHWIPAPLFGGRELPPDGITVHRDWRSETASLIFDSFLLTTWTTRVFTPGVILGSSIFTSKIATARDSVFSTLLTLIANNKPDFAFAHIYSTHAPFAYSKTCQIEPRSVSAMPFDSAYKISVRCLDRELIKFLRNAVSIAGQNTVLLVVGDHGPPCENVKDTVVAQLKMDRCAQAQFEAGSFFYLPPDSRGRFHYPMSSVNLIPALLNAIFETEIKKRPDDKYYSWPRPKPIYRFVQIQ